MKNNYSTNRADFHRKKRRFNSLASALSGPDGHIGNLISAQKAEIKMLRDSLEWLEFAIRDSAGNMHTGKGSVLDLAQKEAQKVIHTKTL